MSTCKRLIFALALLLLNGTASAYELDRIVAVVDQDVIVGSELEQQISMILPQIQQRGTRLPPRPVIEKQVLDRMIDKRLQLQAAKRLGIEVDDATLARAIGNIAEKNNITLAELRDTLESEGVSFAAFREDTREKIVLARLRAQEVVNRITVTDREVQNFLDTNLNQTSGRTEVRLQHILVSIPEGASPEESQVAKRKAERIVDDLRGGADFAELALINSDGRQALEGGDLGWMKISEVPSLAVDAARNLDPGAIADPVRSSSGFHIFRLAEVKGGERQMVTQTHAQHILIKTNELVSDDEARTRLSQLRLRLIGGDDFAPLARSHSEDTGSAIKGGDLGWINPGDTVPIFEQEMDALDPGEISEPFRSPFGWHIVQVLERRQHDNTEQMLKAKAQEKIRERKAEEATEQWLRRLRDEAYVEVRLQQDEGL